MKNAVLICALLFCAPSLYAQLPVQQRVWTEIQRIYSARQSVFQNWKGPIAKDLAIPEYESKYTFPGTSDALIKQRSRNERPTVYYYEGVIAEGKTAPEIIKLIKEWEHILLGCSANGLSLQSLDRTAPDDHGISAVTLAMLNPSGDGRDRPQYANMFRIRLNYDQGDDSLYTAYIQIGCP